MVGPLLRFGYNPVPRGVQPMEWLGTCNSMIRRNSYDQVGGFSGFFLHRCTMNEDVDLGIKLSRIGKILLCPDARMAHEHAPGGRVSVMIAAEDDLYNRYFILRRTVKYGILHAYGLAVLFLMVETIGPFLGGLYRLRFDGFIPRLAGRIRALAAIAVPALRSRSY